VCFELIVSIVMVVLDWRFLDRAVDALDPAIGPRMLDFGQPMFDVILLAAQIESMSGVSRPSGRTGRDARSSNDPTPMSNRLA
jgi:hypothetical protein